jgi:hypothetical protein
MAFGVDAVDDEYQYPPYPWCTGLSRLCNDPRLGPRESHEWMRL